MILFLHLDIQIRLLHISQMVNLESDFNKILVKKVRFIGVYPTQAIESNNIANSKSTLKFIRKKLFIIFRNSIYSKKLICLRITFSYQKRF